MPRRTTRKKIAEAQNATLESTLQWLEQEGEEKQIAELTRYGITAHQPFGVTVGKLKEFARQAGRRHTLCEELWATSRYEARMLAAFVGEPHRLTLRQMDRWAKEFDNWAIVDTVCMHLFDRSPLAWKKPAKWVKSKHEFTRRAAFALLWSLSVHDKAAEDEAFVAGLELIEDNASDERNFVKKAANMALRAIGKRNLALNEIAIQTGTRLSESEDPTSRWIGRHAVRELTSEKVQNRLK